MQCSEVWSGAVRCGAGRGGAERDGAGRGRVEWDGANDGRGGTGRSCFLEHLAAQIGVTVDEFVRMAVRQVTVTI